MSGPRIEISEGSEGLTRPPTISRNSDTLAFTNHSRRPWGESACATCGHVHAQTLLRFAGLGGGGGQMGFVQPLTLTTEATIWVTGA